MQPIIVANWVDSRNLQLNFVKAKNQTMDLKISALPLYY